MGRLNRNCIMEKYCLESQTEGLHPEVETTVSRKLWLMGILHTKYNPKIMEYHFFYPEQVELFTVFQLFCIGDSL